MSWRASTDSNTSSVTTLDGRSPLCSRRSSAINPASMRGSTLPSSRKRNGSQERLRISKAAADRAGGLAARAVNFQLRGELQRPLFVSEAFVAEENGDLACSIVGREC